jgi:hypothetical protein
MRTRSGTGASNAKRHTYAQLREVLSLGVFADLNRPNSQQLEALARRVGFRDEHFSQVNEDPAIEALKHLLRATNTARDAKQTSADFGEAVTKAAQRKGRNK